MENNQKGGSHSLHVVQDDWWKTSASPCHLKQWTTKVIHCLQVHPWHSRLMVESVSFLFVLLTSHQEPDHLQPAGYDRPHERAHPVLLIPPVETGEARGGHQLGDGWKVLCGAGHMERLGAGIEQGEPGVLLSRRGELVATLSQYMGPPGIALKHAIDLKREFEGQTKGLVKMDNQQQHLRSSNQLFCHTPDQGYLG